MSTTARYDKKPILPPEEKFWQRYSPHHELPLAGATSFFLHGLVLGTMALAAVWVMFQRDSESNKPVSIDVVTFTGSGDGSEGAGGEPGGPGEPARLTEFTPGAVAEPREISPETSANLKDAAPAEFAIPEVVQRSDELESMLANLEKDAAQQANKTPPSKPAKIAMPKTGNPKGRGGLGGAGDGPGKGSKGTGIGLGGVSGRKATTAEIYAWRWRFDLRGGGKEHVDKYVAMGVTVALRARTESIISPATCAVGRSISSRAISRSSKTPSNGKTRNRNHCRRSKKNCN